MIEVRQITSTDAEAVWQLFTEVVQEGNAFLSDDTVSAYHLELQPNGYRISLMGVTIGEADIHPDRHLAINPGQVFGTVEGIAHPLNDHIMPQCLFQPPIRNRPPGHFLATHLYYGRVRFVHHIIRFQRPDSLAVDPSPVRGKFPWLTMVCYF